MISYFSELRYKEVIDVHTGKRLGYVCDCLLYTSPSPRDS